MKKILLFLTVLGLVCCGSYPKHKNQGKNALLGKWYVYSENYKGHISIREYGKCGKEYIHFMKDNTMKTVNYYERDGKCIERVRIDIYLLKDGKLVADTNRDGEIDKEEMMDCKIDGDKLILEYRSEDILTFKRLK